MTTITSGDVIEFEAASGPRTALVLLASGDALIIDLLDGRAPWSVLTRELPGVRRFDPRVMLQQVA